MQSICTCDSLNCVPAEFKDGTSIQIDENLFISAVNRPCITLSDLHTRSTVLVEWKCEECGNLFQKSPQDINKRKSLKKFKVTCEKCTRKFSTHSSRGVTLFKETLPLEASEFVRNLDNPSRDLTSLASRSHDKCEWKCLHCGNLWITTPDTRSFTKRGTGCNSCNKNKIGLFHMENHKGGNLKDLEPEIFK